MGESRSGGWENGLIGFVRSTPRLIALLYFAQSLFLVFAAVYIAKESIEQVILGSGAHDHALSGSHGHGEAAIDGDVRWVHLHHFPHLLFDAVLIEKTESDRSRISFLSVLQRQAFFLEGSWAITASL